MLRKMLVVVLCGVLVTTGCASASGARVAQAPQPALDRSMLADYAQRLPAGSRVRVELTNGQSFRGTLMKATADAIVVQKNTRVPEPPVQIRLDELTRLTLDTGGSNVGRTVAIGVGAGVAATFGVLLLLFALVGD